MISIALEEFENSKEFEDLRNDVSDILRELSEEVDDETRRKMLDLKEDLEEKYLDDPEVDEKLGGIKSSFYDRFMTSFESKIDIDPGRLLGLTDGIFGMVMTLLVFALALPEIELVTAGDFLAFIQSIAHNFGVTVISFILVSSFWVYHHEFIKIKNLNFPFIWFNIFFLASISFIPFTTSIIGSYSQFFLAEVIFGVNILLAIIFFLIMLRYASNNGFLERKLSEKEKKYIYNTFYIMMGLTVVVNLLDFNVSSNFIYLYLLIPVISTIRDIKFKMDS